MCCSSINHPIKLGKRGNKGYNKINHRITALFRFLELLLFFAVASRFSAHLSSSFHLTGDFLRRRHHPHYPHYVFFIGNAIVVTLFLISRHFSGEKSADFYEECVEKCRSNGASQQTCIKAAAALPEKVMIRAQSANLERVQAVRGEDRRRDLRRNMSDKCRKKAQEEMSGEEFRRTVEAFIARKQRFLREEEGVTATAVVSL